MKNVSKPVALLLLLAVFAAASAEGQEKKKPSVNAGPVPKWIWAESGNSPCRLEKRFAGGAKSALLVATCDNSMTIYLNDKKVAESSEWQYPVKLDVTKHLASKENKIRVDAANAGGPMGLVLKLILTMPDGTKQYVVTDSSWKSVSGEKAKPTSVKELAKLGDGPWGNVFQASALPISSAEFKTLPGFQVERLYQVPRQSQGSWVAITFDHKGRIIASDQGGQGLFRITPAPIGSNQETIVEKIDVKMTGAQGMLYAFGKLYCSVNGGPGSGFYVVEDVDNDDRFDKVTKLKEFQGGGEHGPHAVKLSPDGQSIYVIAGNHTNPPKDFDHSRVPKNWAEDHLLPRQWDARGHARGKLAPGGWVAKTDPQGKTWEIFSSGYRNPYDMDFNVDGELFVYDADMEWDMGMPWYRPTRVSHSPSGSELGWRSGTGKWPSYYVDSLPATVDIGPGSPVGVTFGYGTRFPAKYQRALFILDWTFGTIYALHFEAKGASYLGVKEEFLSRAPLPLTDVAIGPDGAMYFTIGGRGTQSALFRVTYTGKESTLPAVKQDKRFAHLREIRHELESMHHPVDRRSVEKIWPYLQHSDRHIRYAARVALEHQDIQFWQERGLVEKEPVSAIQAVVALARQGDRALQPRLLAQLNSIDLKSLSESSLLDALLAYQLVFSRMENADPTTQQKIVGRLDPFYPSNSDAVNRELSQLLVYLNSPTVAIKTLKLLEAEVKIDPLEMNELLARNRGYGGAIAKMLANQPQIEKLHLAFVLRNLRYGWTLEERKRYFDFLNAQAQKSGGASYQGFINNIRKDALANASEAERKALIADTPPPKPVDLPKPKGPGRAWTMDAFSRVQNRISAGRNFENGRISYSATRCVVCHRFDGSGGATGPDLTNAAGRFSPRDLFEAIIQPSKVISDQYNASIIETVDGQLITGRIISEDDTRIVVQTDPEDATKIAKIAKADIESQKPSKVSLMPDKLIDTLNEQEMLDLMAYLLSRGNPKDPAFRNRDK